MRYPTLTKLCAALAVAVLTTWSLAADKEAKVQVGKPAPNIELPATLIESVLPGKKDATTLSLKDLKGKNVVLFFYPKAMTPGCTKESCAFRDNIKGFVGANTVVIGISTDNVSAQKQFTDKEKLNFPLFADSEKKVTGAYGVLNAQRGVASRVTFVIDKQGIVRKIYTKVDPPKHAAEVLEYIKTELKD